MNPRISQLKSISGSIVKYITSVYHFPYVKTEGTVAIVPELATMPISRLGGLEGITIPQQIKQVQVPLETFNYETIVHNIIKRCDSKVRLLDTDLDGLAKLVVGYSAINLNYPCIYAFGYAEFRYLLLTNDKMKLYINENGRSNRAGAYIPPGSIIINIMNVEKSKLEKEIDDIMTMGYRD